MASAIAIIDEQRQLIATETGLHVRDVATGKLTLHTPIEADNPLTRSNDSRVHPCGALWTGTMGKKEEKAPGSIYWFFKGELRRLFSDITVSNSICFSGDGALAYYTDTSTGLLMRVACDSATGLPAGEPTVFVDHRSSQGLCRRIGRRSRRRAVERRLVARWSRPTPLTARCCARSPCR